MNLPGHRRPVAFHGTGNDPVWMIDDADLASDLHYRADPGNPRHGFIEPGEPMTLDEYQRAVQQTRGLWQRVTSWPLRGSSGDGS
jgi:hypothetical protein